MQKIIPLVLFILAGITIQAQVSRKDFRTDLEIRHQVNSDFNELYLQNSDISFVTFPYSQIGMDNLTMLTANLVPHYFVFPKQWRIGLTLTPQIRIRIWDARSYPIKTPSFIPHATMYFKLNLNKASYKYLSLRIAHHSNGQDGAPRNPDGTVNLRTGNFNTNYIEAAANFGSQLPEGNHYYKLGLELHSGLLGILDEPAFRDQFGKIRINFRTSGTKYINLITTRLFKKRRNDPTIYKQELWRTVFDGMVIIDKNVNIEWYQRFNAELKVYRKIKNSPNTAWFFSAGYLGHDYYNVYFLHHYPIIRLGLAAGTGFLYKNIKK